MNKNFTQKKNMEATADVIILDSSDEDVPKKKIEPIFRKDDSTRTKRKNGEVGVNIAPTKRIKPLKIADVVSLSPKAASNFNIVNNNYNDHVLKDVTIEPVIKAKQKQCTDVVDIVDADDNQETPKPPPKTEIEIAQFFLNFLEACRKADPSNDMQMLIDKKLIRYYRMVHPDFINSKSFRKNVERVSADIEANPSLVYLKITGIIEELKIRKKSNTTVMSNEEVTGSTGNEKKDKQLKKLNKALYILKKKIANLEEEEVDFEEDHNSSYMMVERHKKRAWEIYEKICDITGESKHAHRSVRKPINFTGTSYPEFNKAIQTFVNRNNAFPDYVDVYKCLEYCNTKYKFKLKVEDMKKIAADAFTKIGKLLQNRRQADLYETVTYFIGVDKDPATEDKDLLTKLSDNKIFHSRISAIIDKYAEEQEQRSDDCDESVENNEVPANRNTENDGDATTSSSVKMKCEKDVIKKENVALKELESQYELELSKDVTELRKAEESILNLDTSTSPINTRKEEEFLNKEINLDSSNSKSSISNGDLNTKENNNKPDDNNIIKTLDDDVVKSLVQDALEFDKIVEESNEKIINVQFLDDRDIIEFIEDPPSTSKNIVNDDNIVDLNSSGENDTLLKADDNIDHNLKQNDIEEFDESVNDSAVIGSLSKSVAIQDDDHNSIS